MDRKIYVEVVARFAANGTLLPVVILWDDGREFTIEKVLDRRRASSLKSGGSGLRYTCRIKGKQRYLFYDDSESGLWKGSKKAKVCTFVYMK